MLYHGTTAFIDTELEPRISFEGKAWVYSTDDWTYALIRSGKFNIEKCLIREEHEMNHHSLCEVYPGAFKEVFDRPGYIYEVDENDFMFRHSGEYVSNRHVKIIKTIYVKNVLDELKKHPSIFELITYDKSDNYWAQVKGGREGYIKRRKAAVAAIKGA